MFAAITGLNAMGTAMSVISNNIANVNTVGFKASRANFQDLLSQSSHTASGLNQIGRGASLSTVTEIFSQGSFQNSSQDTDIAISGDGFFQVRDPLSGQLYYTRAGNFIINNDGQLINPSGYILQGWELDVEGNRVGTPTDVVMFQNNAPPAPTTQAQWVINLDASSTSRTADHLSTVWDGTEAQSIDGDRYVYQTSLSIYDDLGNSHDLSIFFDPDDTLDNVWNYIITCDPSEDTRRLEDQSSAGDYTGTSGTSMAGLFMRGTIAFDPDGTTEGDSGGRIQRITAQELQYDSTCTAASATSYMYWSDLTTNDNGLYELAASFLSDPDVDLTTNPNADNSISQSIEINFGAYLSDGEWVSENQATTQYAGTSTTILQTQDGYASGYLQSITIDPDGLLTGSYSNNRIISLYQIGLALFRNPWGLQKVGRNLYAESRLSGTETINPAGTGGTGAIAPNALEQSNVDLADEFVDMIVQQRGFQANSKVITTTDSMLAELINLKR